jgi:hypothetical protein
VFWYQPKAKRQIRLFSFIRNVFKHIDALLNKRMVKNNIIAPPMPMPMLFPAHTCALKYFHAASSRLIFRLNCKMFSHLLTAKAPAINVTIIWGWMRCTRININSFRHPPRFGIVLSRRLLFASASRPGAERQEISSSTQYVSHIFSF